MLRFQPHKDSRGVILEPGQRVAYNRSGDVIEGEVLDVDCRRHIKVQPHADFRANRSYSKVRHGRSILVLA